MLNAPCQVFIALVVAYLAGSLGAAEADAARYRLSWLHIDQAMTRQTLVEGQSFDVAVEYALQDGPPATLVVNGYGPWVDLPDGTYQTKRRHMDYRGLAAEAVLQPGKGRQVFTFTVPTLHGQDSILWVVRLRDPDGTWWPWQVRSGSGPLERADPALRLTTTVPGNLFTYAEPVQIDLGFGSAVPTGSAIHATWRVLDRDGAVSVHGVLPVTVPAAPATVPLTIALDQRGVFALEVDLDTGISASTTFARIPDVLTITRGEPTRFGLHHILDRSTDAVVERRLRTARRLGLTSNRQFVRWRDLQPARDVWRFDDLDHMVDQAHAHGIAPLLCLVNPPPWAVTRGSPKAHDYVPFELDDEAWSAFVTTIAKRYQGRVAGYEWLNEIVPGDGTDPIGTYLRMVRLGNAAAKAEDSDALSLLAGGLWPQSYRTGLLAAGIGAHIDVLPIHYGSAAGARTARADLDAAGATTVAVWDNETAQGVSTWGMPLTEAIARREQRAWAMTRFPGLLQAGTAMIQWFGGSGDPAGNWDFQWRDGSPRPVAATLAVMAAKLHGAVAQGSFTLGDSGAFHLFAIGERAVLVAPGSRWDLDGSGAAVASRATLDAPGNEAPRLLRVGAQAVTTTDDQGEERILSATDGVVALSAAGLPVYVEGADLQVLRGYTAPDLLTTHLSVLPGRDDQVRVRVTNRGDTSLAGTLTLKLPTDWPAATPSAFAIAPGAAQVFDLAVTTPATTNPGEHLLSVACRYNDARLPPIDLAWRLAVVDPQSLGNLLVAGDMETEGHQPWTMDVQTRIVATDDFTHGLGQRVLRMTGSTGWQHASHPATLTPGRSYLYSAWVRVDDKEAGSNIGQTFADGTQRTLYFPHVFSATRAPGWQYLRMVYHAPEELVSVGFTPVARGDGTAWFDHVRVTPFMGTRDAAEATAAATPPIIDGDLSDWAGGCAIPLLGPGQTVIFDDQWQPSATNVRGVAKLRWDEHHLYLAAWIDDDHLAAPHTGERTMESDSLVLALHPDRAGGDPSRAFCFYLSPAAPGGGSGIHTLYRPAPHAGGLASGQLAKDSSVYELRIRRTEGMTLYEARFPWSELGVAGRLGMTLGASLVLNDNDGNGRAAAVTWGDGVIPTWNPAAFGVITLTQ